MSDVVLLVVCTILGIPLLLVSLRDKRLWMKLFAAFAIVSFLGLAYLTYKDFDAVVSATASLHVFYKSDSDSERFGDKSVSVSGGNIAYVVFIKNKKPTLVLPSSNITQKDMGSSTRMTIFFDRSSEPGIAWLGDSASLIKSSDSLEIGVDKNMSQILNGYIEKGEILLDLNGKKITYPIPAQEVTSSTIRINL